jgi:hypothetical protein
MSLIAETGAGLSNANSYATAADADTRLADRGITNWAGDLSPSEKEQALIRATDFLEQTYRGRWQGNRQYLAQSLSWPRWGVWVDGYPVTVNTVPNDVKNACIDLAFKAAAGELAPDLTRGVVREKVGPIETEYDRYSPQSPRYQAVAHDARSVPHRFQRVREAQPGMNAADITTTLGNKGQAVTISGVSSATYIRRRARPRPRPTPAAATPCFFRWPRTRPRRTATSSPATSGCCCPSPLQASRRSSRPSRSRTARPSSR